MSVFELEQELAALSRGYYPNPEVAGALEHVIMAPIIGPVAVGKSTCLAGITGANPDFARVQSFTTRDRDPRDAPNEYRFLGHDERALTELRDEARRGNLVQYQSHPTTGRIYGSDLSDYPRRYALLDALSDNVPKLRALPFKRVVEITMAAKPEEWAKRFEARTHDKEEAQKRIKEGVRSLTWSLEQGSVMNWVVNGQGRIADTCTEVMGIVQGTQESDPRNRRVGERLLKMIKTY